LKPAAYAQIEESIRRVCCRITEEKRKQDIVEVFQKNSQDKQPDNMQASSYEIVKQIEDILTENISNCEFQVSNVADRLMMNKDYLNRVFKKNKGLAISHYLINERMTLAGKLLKNPKYSVNDVAEMVGYNNYPYFASSFKRFHGCPPLQYKKENEITNM
ncbi:MAG: helix-turn-helix transcriptional regulator, partial [Blautia sp.]|nr:helix-turn-helix transcriptional regulator [Blautia sp.]